MKSVRSVLLAITLAFALTSCTGELSERIESLTLATNSLQEQVEELEAESAARAEALTLATNALQQQVEELKAESAAKSETLEALRKQIEHSTETSIRRYELSDVEAIGFKAEKDETLIHQLSAAFLSSSFLFEDMSKGLVEFWKGSFHFAGEPSSVGIYFYDRNIEGEFGIMKELNSVMGNPHIAVGNIIVECASKKVCEFIVDALKSNSSSDRGIATITPTPQAAPSVSTTDSVIELTIYQLSQAYAKGSGSADGKYKGKTVLATGKVNKAFTKGNRVEVELYGFDTTEKVVVCKLEISQQSAISNLLSSKEITVKGKVLGVPGFSNIVIDPCSIHHLFK